MVILHVKLGEISFVSQTVLLSQSLATRWHYGHKTVNPQGKRIPNQQRRGKQCFNPSHNNPLHSLSGYPIFPFPCAMQSEPIKPNKVERFNSRLVFLTFLTSISYNEMLPFNTVLYKIGAVEFRLHFFRKKKNAGCTGGFGPLGATGLAWGLNHVDIRVLKRKPTGSHSHWVISPLVLLGYFYTMWIRWD